MIAYPSCRQLVELVAAELRTTIAPAVTDPAALHRLAMIDSVLHGVAARCDNEIEWMRAEVAQIERLAERLLGEDAADGSIRVALQRLAAGRAGSDAFDDVAAEYSLASEVLSLCLERTPNLPEGIGSKVQSALTARLDREAEILGPFSLVGRT